MREEEIVKDVVDFLSSVDDATAVAATDFTEERDSNMIVVGITNTEQVNDGLPDYKYTLEILVDTFIESDIDGELFHKTRAAVRRMLDEYVMQLNKADFSQIFGEIPVVGLFFDGMTAAVLEKSNRTSMTYTVVASFQE